MNKKYLSKNQQKIKIYINKDRFPYELPIVFINTEKQKYIPNIPHITSYGYICYLDKEGVVWSNDTEKVLDLIFERVESLLLQNESIEGIHREFQYYFSKVKNLEYMYSYISEGNITRRVKLYINCKNKLKFVFDTNNSISFCISFSKKVVRISPFSNLSDKYGNIIVDK